MNIQHKIQAQGAWEKRPFLEQMAHIGSEIERTLSWKEKGNEDYSKKAFERSLELINLSLSSKNLTPTQIKETARVKEMWVDFSAFDNQYGNTNSLWRSYFLQLLTAFKLSSEQQ